ncbi:MAG: response regulator [Oligoflexia bacterium]|nr:response regulator [Oligoflexia bacterium]
MKKLNVLLVDDAVFIREILRQIFVKAGHTVIGEAEDGEMAVKMAKEKNPDVVIMDIVLPIKSGVQATKEIREAMPNIKVIACSTLDQENMLMKIMEAGAHDFINKPFDVQKVLTSIEKVCGGQSHA